MSDDDGFPRNQAQEIRNLIENLEVSYKDRALNELLYTATETGMLDYRISVEDAIFIAELVTLSNTLSDEDLKKVRM